MASQREIKHYIKQATKKLPRQLRSRLQGELEGNISEFLEHHADSSIQDIVDHFGSPEKYVEEYFAANECDERLQQMKRGKLLSCFNVASVLLIILIICAAAFIICKENSRTAGYYYHYVLTEE